MMSVACLLSVIWAIFFPEMGVHQATDLIQSQHAGLWRGIFSHKQGLGVVAGPTAGMLMFYGSLAFPMVIVRLAALGCAFACVLGSGSITGLLAAILLTVFLYLSYWIARASPRQRRTCVRAFIGMLVVMYLAFHFNLVGFIMPLLGKSADMTGRADCWPMVMENLRNTAPLLGGGYAGGLDVSPSCSIDNGFIGLMVEFGYAGGAILLAATLRPLWGAVKVILVAPPEEAALRIFPLNMMLIQLFLGISESGLMAKCIGWLAFIVSMYQVAQYQSATPIAARRPAGARPPRPPPPRNAGGPLYGRSAGPGNL
jgi:hypothetical protein